jgi:hypothetical protein
MLCFVLFFSFPCLKPIVDPKRTLCFAFGNFSGNSVHNAAISCLKHCKSNKDLNLVGQLFIFIRFFNVPSFRSAQPDAWGSASLWTGPQQLHRTSPPDAQLAHCNLF